MKLFPYLVLMRPANIITAIADILAGIAIAGLAFPEQFTQNISGIFLLIISTIGLYGGGIVFNDFFDADLDKVERPERPIPSGKVSKQQAATLGITLLLIGIGAALFYSFPSGTLALGISIMALIYDKYAKHHQVLGPFCMGLCRAGNLLLGISISIISLENYWMVAFLPLIFIAAITLTSQGENIGNNRTAVSIALGMDLVLAGILLYLGIKEVISLWILLPFLALWLFMNMKAKITAIFRNEPQYIMKAVKMGVISLIPLNASYAAGFNHWVLGLIILSLLPISMFLGKKFAIT